MNNIKLFCTNEIEDFTQDLAWNLDIKKSVCDIMKFSNDNSFCQYGESVRGKDVYIVVSSKPNVNDRVMEALIMIDAARRASARTINLILPYFNYSRSDKKDQPRIPITASLVAHLYETAGADRIITCDLHNLAIQGFFKIPVDVLTMVPVLAEQFEYIENPVVVSTDAGGIKRARQCAKVLNCSVAMIDKRRDANNDKAISTTVVGDVKNKNAIIIDDEISTAGTLCEAARILEDNGVNKIYAACTHGVLCGPAMDRIENSPIDEVFITDTIPYTNKPSSKVTVVPTTQYFANAIKCVQNRKSIVDTM